MKSSSNKTVLLAGLPSGFIDDLPDEDQQAVREAVGRPVVCNGYDENGRAELEFADEQGVRHFIYVDPQFTKSDDPSHDS